MTLDATVEVVMRLKRKKNYAPLLIIMIIIIKMMTITALIVSSFQAPEGHFTMKIKETSITKNNN